MEKAAKNFRKHDVSFNEAATVFGDAFSTTARDPDHSIDEDRYITIGMSINHRLIMVAIRRGSIEFASSVHES